MALSLGSIVDSLIVANFLERTAFSAVGLCQPISLCFNTVFNFFGVGGATLAAIYKGKKEEEKANTIFSSVLVILGIFSILFLVLGMVFLHPIANALSGGDATVFTYVKQYAVALFAGCPFIIMVSGSVFFVRTDGQPKLSAMIIIVSNIANLVFDFFFVAVIKTGIVGASISTVLGYFIGGLLLIKYFRSKERTFRLVKPAKNLFSLGKTVAASGVSSGLNTGLMFLKNLCVNLTVIGVAALGEMGVAAFSVCNQTLTLSALFVGGTVQTILPIIGVLYGEEDNVGIRMTLKTAFQFAFSAAAVICILLEVFAGGIAGLFNLNGEAKEVAVHAIRIYSLILPFYAFNFMMINFYQTTQKKLLAGVLSILQGFAFVVPSVKLLSNVGDGTSLWFGFLIGESLTFGCIWLLSYLYGKKYQLHGLFLEKECVCGEVMEMTIPNRIEDAVKVSEEITEFCRKNHVSEKTANLAAVAAEEMAVNIIKYGYQQGKLEHIDISVRLIDNEVILRLRDDGIFFNPLVFQAEGMEFSGIENVKKITKSMQYSRVLGFNTVILKL